MANFEIPKEPSYSSEMRKLEKKDRGHADVFNERYGRLLENCEYVKKQEEGLREDFDNLLEEETIQLAKELGFLSGGGV